MELNEINDKTMEGRLLMMAVAALTVSPEVHINGEILDGRKVTPMEMLDHVKAVADEVYKADMLDDFNAAANPLIKYLANEQHPHLKAIVTSNGAELVEGLRSTFPL